MINEQLKEVIKKYNIEKTENIIYGTNIPMPKTVIPTPWKTYIKFDNAEFYFFYFDENGITLYLRDGSDSAVIPWSEIEEFKMSKFLIIGKMTIKTKDNVLKFQINRFVIGCPWIKKNIKYLETNNYFYPKTNRF